VEKANYHFNMCLTEGCKGAGVQIDAQDITDLRKHLGIPNQRLQDEAFRDLVEGYIYVAAIATFCEPDFAPSLEKLSDEMLCKLLDAALNGQTVSVTGSQKPKAEIEMAETMNPRSDLVSVVISLLLVREFDRRRNKKETISGRLIRKWVVAKDELTGKEADRLTRLCQYKRRYNPQGLGDSAEENASLVWQGLVQVLQADLLSTQPIVTSKGGFSRLLSAPFNTVLFKVDNLLRNRVDTETRRANARREEVETEEIEGESSWDFPIKFYNRTLDEWTNRAQLTESERQVIELKLQDLNQTTIAERLSISQPRVSQLLNNARKKLREVYRPNA